jgi:hypothetical protein
MVKRVDEKELNILEFENRTKTDVNIMRTI